MRPFASMIQHALISYEMEKNGYSKNETFNLDIQLSFLGRNL